MFEVHTKSSGIVKLLFYERYGKHLPLTTHPFKFSRGDIKKISVKCDRFGFLHSIIHQTKSSFNRQKTSPPFLGSSLHTQQAALHCDDPFQSEKLENPENTFALLLVGFNWISNNNSRHVCAATWEHRICFGEICPFLRIRWSQKNPLWKARRVITK